MSSSPSLASLEAMPDGALVPVEWVKELVADLDTRGAAGLGLTVREVAEAADRAPSTVRTWCADGRLPGARRLRGREWRIPRTALQALLEGETSERPSTADRLEVPRGGLSAWRRCACPSAR